MSTVVILISDKRSGSTMFQRELCRHPDIAHVEYSPHSHYETHHWLKGAVMLNMAQQLFSGGKRYPGYGSPKNARTYLIDCMKGNVPEYVVKSDGKELVFDAWEALCEKYANPVFFEKSPQYIANWASLSLLLEWSETTHRDVKIIGLTRNPMSVMYSAQTLFYTDPRKRQFSWLKLQQNLLTLKSILPVDSFLHCKYEDIVEKPQEHFANVCRFIGVEPQADMGSSIHSESLKIWKEDPEFDFHLDETVAQFAGHFDYSKEELENPMKEGTSRWNQPKFRLYRSYKIYRNRFFNRFLKPLLTRLVKQ